jgi:hypothetical protein
MTSDKGGDVYLESTSTYSYQYVLLTDSIESHHMKPHKEWFFEYEQYDGGDVFLGYELTTRIVRWERV